MLEAYFRYLLEQKNTIGLICICSSLTVLIISLFLTNTYLSTSTLSPTRDNFKGSATNTSQFGAIVSSIGIGGDDASPELKFAFAYFNSYRFLAEFIFEYDLVDDILAFKKYNSKEKKIILSKDANLFSNAALFKSGEIDFSNPSLQKAVKELRKIVSLKPGRENDPSMYLSVYHPSPEFAYYLNSNLISALNNNISSIDIDESRMKIRAMEAMYQHYNAVEVMRVLSKLVESELTKQVLASSVDGKSFIVLDPPLLPFEKYSPRRAILTVNAFLVGLLFSLIYFSIQFMRTNFYVQKQ